MTGLGRDKDTGKIRRRAPEALPDTASLIVYLNRETGLVSIDDEFSTPMETENMLRWALEQQTAHLERVNRLDAGE